MVTIVLLVLFELYMFLLTYVACMNIIRVHKIGQLNGLLWVLCLPFVLYGLILDVLHNVTLFNLIFWDIPRDATVTARLKRHRDDPGFRGKIARFMCEKMLSPFDHTGNHCD